MNNDDQSAQMLLSRQSRVIFDWTPRAGCTAVLCLFLKHVGLLEEVLGRFSWPHDFRDEYYKTYGRVDESALLNPEYRKIKFVRNPYTRAVSCYEFLPTTYTLSFKDFLRVLLEQPSLLTLSEQYHSIPQARASDIHMNHIIKIECMGAKLLELNRVVSTNLESVDHLPVLRDHRCVRQPWPKFAGDIGRNEFPPMRKGIHPSYGDYYDDESRRLVERAFGRDVEAFGYSFDFDIGQPPAKGAAGRFGLR